MIAAIYARKSNEQNDVTEEQKSVTRQIDGARRFISTKGWTISDEHVYVDDGVSGALFTGRPEFQRMMRDAQAGAFDALVLFDLDRFGRHAQKTMEALNALADVGVTVWDSSTGRARDLDTFEGRLPTVLEAEFAEMFREKIRKHTTASHRRKAEQGLVTGGKVFGYRNERRAKGETIRVVHEEEADIVREIFSRYGGR